MNASISTPIPETPAASQGLFDRPAAVRWALLALIFAVGLAIRLYDLADPPLDFHPNRQLHSALIARGMFYQANPGAADDAQRALAVTQWRAEGLIEPQVFETVTAWTYSLVGRADLRVPRVYAIIFWLIAAGFITLLAHQLTGWGGALLAALFFLIWPYGVTASRAFQPEPLMIALMAAAVWAAVRWEHNPTWAWTVAAGVLAGLAIYIKAVALFILVPVLIVLVLAHRKFMVALRDPQIWALVVLTMLPYGIYLINGVWGSGLLVDQFSLRFFPQMWLDPAFYLRWISNLGRVLPFELVLVALLGTLLVRRPAYRLVLLSMWFGYFLYGMTLPHHISTHDYYHLPLFLPAALGLAAVGETLFQHLRGPRWLARAAASVVLLAALVITGYADRNILKRSDSTAQARVWEEVGQALGPGSSVVALVPDYGSGLAYYAWITPSIWPSKNDISFRENAGQSFDFAAFFDSQVGSKDYFVITLPDELDNQPDLKRLLTSRYPVLRQGEGYQIFDLRSTKVYP